MSAFACGRCAECDGGRGAQFCLAPRGMFRLATLDEATTPHERLRQMAPELLAALVQLVDAAEDADHLEECNVGFCDCAAAQWQAHAAAARAVIARATGGEP